MSASIIASICLMTALLQLLAGLLILDNSIGYALLGTADVLMVTGTVLPLILVILLNLAAAVTVYLMRIEALACLGCLLARRLVLAVGSPVQLISVLDLVFLLVLLYFTMRLFRQSPVLRFRMLLIGLTLGHLSSLLPNMQFYPVMVSTGYKAPLVVLAALAGCAALYVAVLAMRSRRELARRGFLFAALAMGLTLPAWGLQRGFTAPFWLGVPVALLGFGLTRQQHRPGQVSAH